MFTKRRMKSELFYNCFKKSIAHHTGRSSSTSLSRCVVPSVKSCLNVVNNEYITLPGGVKRFNWQNEGAEIKMAASKFEITDCFSF